MPKFCVGNIDYVDDESNPFGEMEQTAGVQTFESSLKKRVESRT
jgi:hypothetical protein